MAASPRVQIHPAPGRGSRWGIVPPIFDEMEARIMTMEAFDTLAFAKKLKNAGVPEEQAEAMAEVQADTFRGFLDSSLATKADLKIEIGGLRSRSRVAV